MDIFHNDNRFQDIIMNALYWGQYLRETHGEALIPYMFLWNNDKKFTNMLQPGGDPEEFAYRVAGKSDKPFNYFVVGYEGELGTAEGIRDKAIIVKAYKRNQSKGIFLAQLFEVDAQGKFVLKEDPIVVDTPANPLELDSSTEELPYQDVVSNGIVVKNDEGMERYVPFFTHDNPAAIAGSIKNYVRQKLSTADKSINSGEFNIQVNPIGNGGPDFMKYVVFDTVRSEKTRPSTLQWEKETGRKLKFNASYGDEKLLEEIEAIAGTPKEDSSDKLVKKAPAAASTINLEKRKPRAVSEEKGEYEAEYESLTAMELKREVNRLRSIPNARTNIDALTRMTALMAIMERRGIDLPGQRSTPRYEQQIETKEKTSPLKIILMVIIAIVILLKIIRGIS